jgi:hypothetical protein
MHIYDTIISRLSDDARETSGREWIQGFAGLAWLSGNLVLTILRESPLFWRNAGGYPIALRDFTLHFYYPILVGSMAICCAHAWQLLRQSSIRFGCSIFSRGFMFLLWGLLFLNCGLMVANNVDNIIEGRPLHYHETD